MRWFKPNVLNLYNPVKFSDWLKNKKLDEMMGSVGSIVSCRDLKDNNFQVQGALSDLRCRKKEKTRKMRFN